MECIGGTKMVPGKDMVMERKLKIVNLQFFVFLESHILSENHEGESQKTDQWDGAFFSEMRRIRWRVSSIMSGSSIFSCRFFLEQFFQSLTVI